MTWRTCLCSGSQYWRYRGRYGVDRGYPKSLSIWRNVRRPVDDVFQYYGVTYFFSGTGYQVFNDYRFNVSFTHLDLSITSDHFVAQVEQSIGCVCVAVCHCPDDNF